LCVGGGAHRRASTTDGHRFAFGNTAESLIALVLGLPARGSQSDGPFDRLTGSGWVREHHGQYADALSKGHGAVLLGAETTGAFLPGLELLLKVLARQARAPGTHDSTVYGTARSSARTFYPHHAAAISSSIVTADALTITNHAASLSFQLSMGLVPIATAAA